MPTNRTKREHKARRPHEIPDRIVGFLRTGHWVAESAGDYLYWSHWPNLTRAYKELKALGFVDDFIEENPGKRPWGWWVFDSPEPEKVDDGGPEYEPLEIQRRMLKRGRGSPENLHFGIPTLCYDYSNPPGWVPSGQFTFESEATYLDRHGFIDDAERNVLPADAFDPVELEANPFYGLRPVGLYDFTKDEMEQLPVESCGKMN